MDEQLNVLPCGYFVLSKDWEFIEMNRTMKDMLGMQETPRHMHDILTVPSRVYFQTYFIPAINVHGKVREMYLNLKAGKRSVPVLMNVNERDGRYEGIIIQIKVRDEYETQLLKSKQEAERIQRETDTAYNKLLGLLQEVEDKQKQLLQLNDELQELATRDELTGLYNRRIFQKGLTAAVDQAKLFADKSFSLLLFDIDHFKRVNDTYGHHIGDEVLKELAAKLHDKIRPPHIAARIGGEEFGVIFYDPDHEQNIIRAEELRSFVEHSGWNSIPVTISMGITEFSRSDNPSQLYIRADEAQYVSKHQGRNRLTKG